MANPTAKTIYYLPGYGGQLATGLGRALMDRGFDVAAFQTFALVSRLKADSGH